ncbi:cardiotrophin-2-like [Bos indicus x Bos taurus]|uniref:cardiotrophin-2-like n=1 Tax=Bos indicus x Bos taurus TaxID=30522 RepID=UPI000F7D460D|nr:cardiotrophin-2-like [Bos indicus x Bos taurus]
MSESAGEVRDLVLTSDFSLPAPFCLLALLLPPLSLGAPMSTAESVNQAYNLALDMQRHTSTLLQTYLQDQGRPFSNPRFSSPTLSLETLPSTDMPFEIWHGLEDGVRLSLTQEAFWSFSQHFRIAMVDQHILHHGDSIVEDQLWEARLKAKGLAGNLAAIMTSLGLPSPAANTPLGPVPLGDSAYRKKCRGSSSPRTQFAERLSSGGSGFGVRRHRAPGTGPRPPAPSPLLLDDTGGVSNAEGCGWRVARSGVPTGTLAGETPGSFSPTPRQPELAFLPRETRNKEVPLLRVARGTPLPLGKVTLFLKQLTWLLREP